MNQRSITEGLSRLVRIPALHAGGHGFKSHPLHAVQSWKRAYYLLMKVNNEINKDWLLIHYLLLLILKLVTTSKNDLAVVERREVSLELEEKDFIR
jgi:hypothetical protein